jgi:hypothetical protein
MSQLQIDDRRGRENSLRLVLTDGGFKLNQYGNEIIDATEINKYGLISIKTNRLEEVPSPNESYKIYKIKEY